MALTKKQLGELYRPVGPKLVQTLQWSGGGQGLIAQAIDLSLPIRGMRLRFTGRVVTGTAAFTSVGPEGLLNLISGIIIQATNARQKGNLTFWNCDLATAWVYAHMFGPKGAATFYISTGGAGADAAVPDLAVPFPAAGTAVPNRAAGFFTTATGTYDFKITVDLPFHPHKSNSFGKHPMVVPAFLVRNEEVKDSLQVQLNYGNQLGNATGSLGVAAATTTVTFSAYNSGSGSPTIEIYTLPIVMGLDQKDMVLPGVLSRVTQPLGTVLQSAATGFPIFNMQKQPTPRILIKLGLTNGISAPAFGTLSDASITALGLLLGGNRNVRNKVALDVHKHHQADVYDREPIQGYTIFDFIEQGNPDSSYPGQDVGDGATMQIAADIPGTANSGGLILQEQILHAPSGVLYS
jgi:hypothetical protein